MSKYVVMVWERDYTGELDLTELSGIIHDTEEEAYTELFKAEQTEGYIGRVERLGHLDAIDKILEEE